MPAPKRGNPEGRFGYEGTFRVPTLSGLQFARVPNLLASPFTGEISVAA